MRHGYTFFSNLILTDPYTKSRCENVIKETLISFNNNMLNEFFKTKMRHFFRKIGFIQKRLKAKLITKDAKCEILRIYWNRLLFWLFYKAN